ncbi:uncharacterized protein L201_002225 [Kwoniella dendrophila CBS 6074]|uniref:Zinc finger FYVE domain-containing protein 19 n=1 Tax=Kwoniella dendrophila CBS 6074 TaxID=1295534 RepID=A0AAX4JQK2_9TREE
MPEDDDLFKRFAALRAPTTTLPDPAPPLHAAAEKSYQHNIDESARKAKEEDDELERIAEGRFEGIGLGKGNDPDNEEDDELAKRIAKLRGMHSSFAYDGRSMDNAADDADDDIEDFLASIAATPSHEIKDENTNPSSLVKDAKAALKQAKPHIQDAEQDQENSEDDVEDVETEEQILIRALEEARLEKFHEPSGTLDRQDDQAEDNPSPSTIGGLESLAFPSLPTHIPQQQENEGVEELDAETTKRLNALMGLSPSSHKPGQSKSNTTTSASPVSKSTPKQWNLPGFDLNRDEDTESWCCICNKDATLICLGCDSDIYCDECWRDGHGNGDGQERGHRAKRFVYKKQLIGAA